MIRWIKGLLHRPWYWLCMLKPHQPYSIKFPVCKRCGMWLLGMLTVKDKEHHNAFDWARD